MKTLLLRLILAVTIVTGAFGQKALAQSQPVTQSQVAPHIIIIAPNALPDRMPLGSMDAVLRHYTNDVVFGLTGFRDSKGKDVGQGIISTYSASSGETISQFAARLISKETVDHTYVTNFDDTYKIMYFLKDYQQSTLWGGQATFKYVLVNGEWTVPTELTNNFVLTRSYPQTLPISIAGIRKAHLKAFNGAGALIWDQDAPASTSYLDTWGVYIDADRLTIPINLVTNGYKGQLTLTSTNDMRVYDLQTGRQVILQSIRKNQSGQVTVSLKGEPNALVILEMYTSLPFGTPVSSVTLQFDAKGMTEWANENDNTTGIFKARYADDGNSSTQRRP